MGGRFTTVEGTLVEVKDQLQRTNPFLGDSVPRSQLTSFLERLSEVLLPTCCISNYQMVSDIVYSPSRLKGSIYNSLSTCN